ncbi:MAG: Ig-like domain-containing protein, partial [Blastocatellia bacterium]
MKPVISRIRSLFIPCTLALIFGALLLQSDQASMKGADKLQLSQSTSSPSARTNKPVQPIATKRFDAVEASSAPNAFFVPLMSASKSVNLATASPGNTLTYNINITNSGGTATTGVLFSDTIDANTTLVPGSVNTSPLALTDSYACTGNLGITVPAASGVLINDFDPDGTIPVIVAVNTAGTQGTVSLNPGNGSFTFNPAPGFEGTTTFSYTLSDGVFSDIGTVSITVSGMIWFIDDSVAGPGDGRLSAPFNSVANFNSLASDDPGDNIFVYSGNYSGSSLVLLANQKLIGQGATASILTITGLSLPPFSNALPATGGTRPTLTNTATNVTVSTGNTIRGVNIQNTTAGSALLGTSFNNLT